MAATNIASMFPHIISLVKQYPDAAIIGICIILIMIKTILSLKRLIEGHTEHFNGVILVADFMLIVMLLYGGREIITNKRGFTGVISPYVAFIYATLIAIICIIYIFRDIPARIAHISFVAETARIKKSNERRKTHLPVTTNKVLQDVFDAKKEEPKEVSILRECKARIYNNDMKYCINRCIDFFARIEDFGERHPRYEKKLDELKKSYIKCLTPTIDLFKQYWNIEHLRYYKTSKNIDSSLKRIEKLAHKIVNYTMDEYDKLFCDIAHNISIEVDAVEQLIEQLSKQSYVDESASDT
jgi:hypothetical protein